MKSYILVTDNLTIKDSEVDNKNLVGKKYEVSISQISLEYEIKKYFNWRKNCNYNRLSKLGTVEYDNFVKHLFNLNY